MTSSVETLRKAPGLVRIHGHRGARGLWPENTLIGFQNTLQSGIDVIELDVLLSKDDIPVVTHNPRLKADTTRDQDGHWLKADGPKVSDLTYAELCTFDVGAIRPQSDYGQPYPEQAFLYRQTIPTLDDVAQLSLQPQHSHVWLNIEVKSVPTHAGLTPDPTKMATKIVEVIQQNNLTERVIVQSFDWRILQQVERLAPQILRSHLTYLDTPNPKMAPNIYPNSPWMAGAQIKENHEDLYAIIAKSGGHIWSPFHEDIVADQVVKAQNIGLIVNAWTVNTVKDIDRMIDIGVDGIITDYPARVQRRLITRNLNWREDYAKISHSND